MITCWERADLLAFLCVMFPPGDTLRISIFWGVSKNDFFFGGGGYEDFVDIIWGHHKIRLYLGVLLCILGSFLKVKVQIFFFFFWGGGGGGGEVLNIQIFWSA